MTGTRDEAWRSARTFFRTAVEDLGEDEVFVVSTDATPTGSQEVLVGLGAEVEVETSGADHHQVDGTSSIAVERVQQVLGTVRSSSWGFADLPEIVRAVASDALDLPVPILWCVEYDGIRQHQDRSGWRSIIRVPSAIVRFTGRHEPTRSFTSAAMDESIIGHFLKPRRYASPPRPSVFPQLSVARSEFLEMVTVAKNHIADGDVYQVQLGHEVLVDRFETPAEVFVRLSDNVVAPFRLFLMKSGSGVVGASPELHLHIDERIATMVPLAGTAPIGLGLRGASALLRTPKERAEHIMLVDLCRNDLGRFCRYGTVRVPELEHVAEYPGVYHLRSTVVGALDPRADLWKCLDSTFPAGTVTGTPKLAAMDIINALEHSKRGLYSGVAAFSESPGHLVSSIVLRSVEVRPEVYSLRASAGVVADSIADHEWTETFAKLAGTWSSLSDQPIRGRRR